MQFIKRKKSKSIKQMIPKINTLFKMYIHKIFPEIFPEQIVSIFLTENFRKK